MLRFLVDESTGSGVAEWLRDAGHDVAMMSRSAAPATDSDILAMAVREDRIVVTNDKDFGELVFRSGKVHAGIILVRLSDESAGNRVRMARFVLERCGTQLAGSFTVVTEKTIRLRPIK